MDTTESMEIVQNYLIIDKIINKRGEELALKEHDDKLIIKHF